MEVSGWGDLWGRIYYTCRNAQIGKLYIYIYIYFLSVTVMCPIEPHPHHTLLCPPLGRTQLKLRKT